MPLNKGLIVTICMDAGVASPQQTHGFTSYLERKAKRKDKSFREGKTSNADDRNVRQRNAIELTIILLCGEAKLNVCLDVLTVAAVGMGIVVLSRLNRH